MALVMAAADAKSSKRNRQNQNNAYSVALFGFELDTLIKNGDYYRLLLTHKFQTNHKVLSIN